MVFRKLLVLETLCVCFVASVRVAEDDYPNVEVPGLAVPSPDDDDFDVNADPTPCDFPAQYQANITSQAGLSGGRGGRAKLSQSTSTVFVDQTNKKIAGKGPAGRFRNETGGFVVIFNDNKTAELYLFKFEAQKCWHKQLPKAEFRPQKIPANATYEGSFNLGPAAGGLAVQSWAFRGRSSDKRGGRTFVGGKIIVTGECYPVLVQDHGMFGGRPREQGNEIEFDQSSSEEDSDDLDRKRPGHGGRGRGFVASIFVSNFVPSIQDPSQLVPPSFCPKTAMDKNSASFNEEPMPEILERFISY